MKRCCRIMHFVKIALLDDGERTAAMLSKQLGLHPSQFEKRFHSLFEKKTQATFKLTGFDILVKRTAAAARRVRFEKKLD